MEVALELGDGRGWKSFEVHARESLDCWEGPVGTMWALTVILARSQG